MKKYDSYKQCLIEVYNDSFCQIFETSWSFTDIKSWMLDTYCIDESSIIRIEISSVTIYKNSKF